MRLHLLRRHAIRVGLALAGLALLIAGCGHDSTAPKTTTASSSTYVGTLAGGAGGTGVSGSLTVTLGTPTPAPQRGPQSVAATVTATGTLTISGTATALTGTFDDVSGALTLSGGGYSISGTRSGVTLNGIFSGPGSVQGGWTIVQSTSSSSARVYCGSYASGTPGGPSGTINLVVWGTNVSGITVDGRTGEVLLLSGALINGTTISIPNPNDSQSPPFATGSLNAGPDTMSGTYDDGAGDNGSWNAARC